MRKKLILIAEDDTDDRYLLQTAFDEAGGTDELVFVEDGAALLEYLEQHNAAGMQPIHPAFILLDLNMPKKDGRQVLKELKESIRLKHIPTIVFSTTRNEVEVRRCYDLGANSYIVKPLSFSELVAIIGQMRQYWLHTATVPL